MILLTELQVREDSMTLFAFGSAAEREAFRQLTSVQGVGGRLALAILTILSPDELARAVSAGDKAMISRASGVGPKLAGILNERGITRFDQIASLSAGPRTAVPVPPRAGWPGRSAVRGARPVRQAR